MLELPNGHAKVIGWTIYRFDYTFDLIIDLIIDGDVPHRESENLLEI